MSTDTDKSGIPSDSPGKHVPNGDVDHHIEENGEDGSPIVMKCDDQQQCEGQSHDNHVTESHDDSPKSSTPMITKKNDVPTLTIDESEDLDGTVKSKPPGHSRKGSSLSQVSIGNSTGSLSRASSFINADSISLPLTLEQLKNDTSARTTSDPALKLTADLSRDDLSDEQRHETLTRLLEEVVALKLEIVNLREENDVLKRARTEMDDELHQLTENLFEEAYKMVDEAKGGKADAEKRLLDAAGQIEAMETKVSALNNLLHTDSKPSSSTSSPATAQKHKKSSVKKMIKKMSRKSTKKLSEPKVPEVPEPILKPGELMSQDFKEFKQWMEKGLPISLHEPGEETYWKSVYSLQISPCLSFSNKQLADKVMHATETNSVLMEPLAGTSVDQDAFKSPCSLTGDSSFPCSYRMKIGNEDTWYYISASARNKIVSVCDFVILVGYVRRGIVKKEAVDLYWQLSSLRASMSLAALNLCLSESTSS